MNRLLLLIIFLTSFNACSQHRTDALKTRLYQLQDNIEKGDLSSLEALASYLDDTSFVQEFLGYHNYPNNARDVALRVLQENCLFKPEEYRFDSSANKVSFLAFLHHNKVVFDDLSGTFLVTPLEKRNTVYLLKYLSDYDIEQVSNDALKVPYPGWYYKNQLDGFLLNKDPQALLWIASEWFQRRSRFNVDYFQDEEFKNLIKRLTHIEIGVPGEKGEITFLYIDDYYGQAKLNFLIYWAVHYGDYKWNEQKLIFENMREQPAAKSIEETLFPRLQSKDNKLALDAYLQLTELDPAIVKQLADAYEYRSIDRNDTLPLFAYRFLPQLAVLTKYCRSNGISYTLPSWLRDSLKLLSGFPSFPVKHRVENNIIRQLTLQEITALEYYGLTGTDYDRATFSLGRILDKFYSEQLEKLSVDSSQLSLFLFKAKLFDELGIIGNCNKYLRKFERCKPAIIGKVKQLQSKSNNEDIKYQCEEALALNAAYRPYRPGKVQVWDGYSFSYGVTDLKGKYSRLQKRFPEADKREIEVPRLIGDISYKQIGEIIPLLLKDTALESHYRFNFLEGDFGIPFDSYDEESVKKFLEVYSGKTERQVYEYYLKETGMHCFDSAGELYFPGIYDLLKYNVVDAFVGGGGGKRDDGVYLIIKLLEFHFNTTLGFSKKRCKSRYGNYCDCTEAAAAWMNYLEEKNLVVGAMTEPLSISPLRK